MQAAEYDQEMKAGEALKGAAMTKFEAGIPTLTPSNDAAVIDADTRRISNSARRAIARTAAVLVGPNLTDNYWIHGSAFTDNVKVIWDGVPAKGMITWKAILKPDQIYDVASYIYTLRGAKLATPGKPPENQTPVKTGPSQFE